MKPFPDPDFASAIAADAPAADAPTALREALSLMWVAGCPMDEAASRAGADRAALEAHIAAHRPVALLRWGDLIGFVRTPQGWRSGIRCWLPIAGKPMRVWLTGHEEFRIHPYREAVEAVWGMTREEKCQVRYTAPIRTFAGWSVTDLATGAVHILTTNPVALRLMLRAWQRVMAGVTRHGG